MNCARVEAHHLGTTPIFKSAVGIRLANLFAHALVMLQSLNPGAKI